jgi:hypothetical protein
LSDYSGINTSGYYVGHIYVDGYGNSSTKGTIIRLNNSSFINTARYNCTDAYGIYYYDAGGSGTTYSRYIIDDCTFWRGQAGNDFYEYSTYTNSDTCYGYALVNSNSNTIIQVQYVARSIHNYASSSNPYNNSSYFRELSGQATGKSDGLFAGYECLIAPFQPAIN